VLGKPVLVPQGEATGMGAAIFAFLAAGTFKTVEEAQDALCLSFRTVHPDPAEAEFMTALFPIQKDLLRIRAADRRRRCCRRRAAGSSARCRRSRQPEGADVTTNVFTSPAGSFPASRLP